MYSLLQVFLSYRILIYHKSRIRGLLNYYETAFNGKRLSYRTFIHWMEEDPIKSKDPTR